MIELINEYGDPEQVTRVKNAIIWLKRITNIAAVNVANIVPSIACK